MTDKLDRTCLAPSQDFQPFGENDGSCNMYFNTDHPLWMWIDVDCRSVAKLDFVCGFYLYNLVKASICEQGDSFQ